ncbi:molybdate ABC transporter substrate-binding protein [Thermoclostridium caenicola]|uniref:Molybdate transport system substrate-binding protein n=1 Tax=Thermoclostridium caenicola TaxID=659425 RepID=A0A1M6IMQ7_9FIRM|nr:molybdate ABC transporter substrate-binding protein [Thermoclostridium caenicola]SHJ35806.1 molybdate transport system substrate-binding protein [Thermoclostridium caenicola]HOP73119.1 molybdate ABC transporter substrate-binding protein [Thermoclostridium caenicola]HPU21806.1 molybdate ABC transporter substrate-binding protein [Thermoclostridium caenicola]
MKKSGFYLFGFLLLVALFAVSLLMGSGEKPVTLTLSAAQSLKDVLAEITALYQEKYPQTQVVVNLGGSGSLQRQIEQGAPVDLFISAAVDNMEQLKNKGLLHEDTCYNLLQNRLVLVTPKDELNINGFDDLLSDRVKVVALGEPGSVPAGKYALEALSCFGMDESIKQKAVYAKDVKEVAAWVESGNAQAGMVYATDVLSAKGLRIAAEAPPESHSPIVYPAGVIKGGQVKEAQRMLKFLFSEEAAAIFEEYGFTVLSGDAYDF